jgi:hypothetical protein
MKFSRNRTGSSLTSPEFSFSEELAWTVDVTGCANKGIGRI